MRLSINVGLHYDLPEPCDLLLQVEVAQLDDQQVSNTRLDLSGTGPVARIPAQDEIGERLWLTASGALVCTYSAEVAIDRPATDLNDLPAVPLHDLPGETVQYLMESRYCPAQDFQTLVATDFGDLSGGAKITAMSDWISANIAYVPGASGPGTTATDTFIQRQGICRDFAHVMITLARAAGIPARFASVYSPDADPPDFHAVAQVYLAGNWHLVDPTGMSRPDNAAIIGIGRDAGDVAFLTSYGPVELRNQSVSVRRL
ncbi:transglutaminase-like domain-containing protein [Aestuariibius sp. 2305UL40-4]|uniref:transglutaminase-like domain-containing protein n=1 Tax=Aestuariibius violaceus TaxID=3234132 RepID=UPI00345E0A2E